jgi:hypothetical protein
MYLFSDLADLPDWLLDLWITSDRSLARPPKTGIKRVSRRGLHTVVVSKDSTTVCSGDTTTVCNRETSDSGLGESGLANLLRDHSTMDACIEG